MAVFRQLDHILIELNEPEKLMTFFSEALGLPVAWETNDFETHIDWATKSYENLRSGGITLGNVNLECARFGEKNGSPTNNAKLTGLAFVSDHSINSCELQLSDLEIEHGEIQKPSPYWSEAYFISPLGDEYKTFICEYYFDNKDRMESLQAELDRVEGGLLGVVGLQTIKIQSTLIKRSESFWKLLLDDKDLSVFSFVEAEETGLLELTLLVRSLEIAKKVLMTSGCLGQVSEEFIFISEEKTFGLKIKLVEEQL